MTISNDFVTKLMNSIRVKSDTAREEIEDLANACVLDLQIAGVYVDDVNDPLCQQAIKLYCKANYGYDADTDRFQLCYSKLKDAMALSGDYAKEVITGE